MTKDEKELLEVLRMQVNALTEVIRYPNYKKIGSIPYSRIEKYIGGIYIGGVPCFYKDKTLSEEMIQEKINALAEALGYEFEQKPARESKLIAKKKQSSKK